jgi:hypothetical protein
MKKYLTTLFLAILVSISFIGCDMSVDTKGIYTETEITIYGTADSAKISSDNIPYGTVIYKVEYPYIHKVSYWSGQGGGYKNITIYNVSDTGFVYVTEIESLDHKVQDTTYHTIRPDSSIYIY